MKLSQSFVRLQVGQDDILDDEGPFEVSDYRLEQLKLDERLATDFNTQQLQKIYVMVTQEQQER